MLYLGSGIFNSSIYDRLGPQDSEDHQKIASSSDAIANLKKMFPPPNHPQFRVIENKPKFKVSCYIMKKTFFGSGNSLKEAKMACSEEAILALGPGIAKKSRQTIQQRPIYYLDDEEEEEIEGILIIVFYKINIK